MYLILWILVKNIILAFNITIPRFVRCKCNSYIIHVFFGTFFDFGDEKIGLQVNFVHLRPFHIYSVVRIQESNRQLTMFQGLKRYGL